eukprot:PRCOL_00006879-RA
MPRSLSACSLAALAALGAVVVAAGGVVGASGGGGSLAEAAHRLGAAGGVVAYGWERVGAAAAVSEGAQPPLVVVCGAGSDAMAAAGAADALFGSGAFELRALGDAGGDGEDAGGVAKGRRTGAGARANALCTAHARARAVGGARIPQLRAFGAGDAAAAALADAVARFGYVPWSAHVRLLALAHAHEREVAGAPTHEGRLLLEYASRASRRTDLGWSHAALAAAGWLSELPGGGSAGNHERSGAALLAELGGAHARVLRSQSTALGDAYLARSYHVDCHATRARADGNASALPVDVGTAATNEALGVLCGASQPASALFCKQATGGIAQREARLAARARAAAALRGCANLFAAPLALARVGEDERTPGCGPESASSRAHTHAIACFELAGDASMYELTRGAYDRAGYVADGGGGASVRTQDAEKSASAPEDGAASLPALSGDEWARVALSLVDALGDLRAARVSHRDLSADNVRVTLRAPKRPSGADVQEVVGEIRRPSLFPAAVVVDFGWAVAIGEEGEEESAEWGACAAENGAVTGEEGDDARVHTTRRAEGAEDGTSAPTEAVTNVRDGCRRGRIDGTSDEGAASECEDLRTHPVPDGVWRSGLRFGLAPPEDAPLEHTDAHMAGALLDALALCCAPRLGAVGGALRAGAPLDAVREHLVAILKRAGGTTLPSVAAAQDTFETAEAARALLVGDRAAELRTQHATALEERASAFARAGWYERASNELAVARVILQLLESGPVVDAALCRVRSNAGVLASHQGDALRARELYVAAGAVNGCDAAATNLEQLEELYSLQELLSV